METSEVLNKAADLIEERGWVQGGAGWPGAEDHAGSLCLEGGILAALGFEFYGGFDYHADFLACPTYRAVMAHLATDDRLYGWNDASSRTAAEVIEVLRACALIESAREEQDAAWAVSA